MRAAYAAWAGWPLSRHLAAIAGLAAVAVLRHWPPVASAEPLVDERFYLAAFRLVEQGASPYAKPGFYYPPAFAHAGAFVLGALGETWTLVLLRSANLLGLGFVAWLAMAWSGLSLGARPVRSAWLAAAGVICLAPGAWLGLLLGNLSFLALAPLLGGLLWWRRRPVAAGLLLGGSLAIKPLAPAAILALLVHRDAAAGRRHRLAGAVAAAVGGALLLLPAGLEEMLAQPVEELTRARIVSLHRALGHLGLGLDPIWVAAAVALATCLAVWATDEADRRAVGPRSGRPAIGRLLMLATAGAALATPLLWNHTLFMTLPLQAAAVHVAWARRSRAPADAVRGRSYELALVLVAVAALLFVNGGGVDDRSELLQALVVAVPSLAPAALAGYVVARTEPF